MNIKCPEWLVRWLLARALRSPFQHIYGPDGSLYMERYTLLSYHNWTGIGARIHVTHRSDMDDEMHDHPWLWNISWLLDGGGYYEEVPAPNTSQVPHQHNVGSTIYIRRRVGDIVLRRLNEWHRLELPFSQTSPDTKIVSVSLFITGPYRQSWGFLARNGVKIPWREYQATKGRKYTDGGNE
jgi:hypothetical protein